MADLLFHKYDLRSVLTRQEQAFANEVLSLPEEQVLNSSLEDLCTYFAEKYTIVPPIVDESNIQLDYSDTQVDISGRFDYDVIDRSGPTFVTGTRFTFFVPFTGISELFDCKPSTFGLNPPRATVRNGELALVYDRTTTDGSGIEDVFERDKKKVEEYLAWIARDLEPFNTTIHEKARQLIDARREKLLSDRGLLESLGFPLRRRESGPTTFVAPEVRRRIAPQLPPPSATPYRPEPTLDMAEYEHILSILSSMVSVMERSPQAFKDMAEEDLRTHFLVHLNGHYEGQATGETFNYEGKTDILIRVQDRNVFIAECKFWRGPSELETAVDQLLGYTSWRDTKIALLVFNRDRDTSALLEKIPDVLRAHTNFKADRPCSLETGFRYIFGHRDDSNREIVLTVLVFDVPG